uniref:Kinesin-like protein n=1 Tax=Neogobius melanostomus TaxID=47308 RepID=A0A8C6V3S6_9GOBI
MTSREMGSESVKVVVRCRPLNDRERAFQSKVVLSMDLERCQCFIVKPGVVDEPPKQFTFDGTYFTDHTTEQMYNEIAYPLVEGVTEGYNGTIFAYGQTGSGKSFTMQGTAEPVCQKGVIPRAFEHVFETIQCAENTKFLVRASYLEIYNEEIRDLLGSETKSKLELKEHPERGVYARDLSMHTVHSVGECEAVLEQGWRNRAVAYTLMNKDSSRSHSIFTIHLEICSTDENGHSHLRAGKLNLVDLAGSERQSKTGATGERLREATKINLSLSALGNVISALVDGRSKYIPYRDSKLTRLLQDSLGGNTRTLMIACLSPADYNYEETLSTLRYANRAKCIQNKPRINEDPKDALLRQYQEEIKKLKAIVSGQLGTTNLTGLLTAQSVASSVSSKPLSTVTEVDKEKIKEEYEGRLAKLQAEYNAEQESKAKLQEDITALRFSLESKLSDLENAQATRGSSEATNVSSRSNKLISVEDNKEDNRVEPSIVTMKDAKSQSAVVDESAAEDGIISDGESLKISTTQIQDQKDIMERLQLLEQAVVGGEQVQNQEFKRRHQLRKKFADQRQVQLIQALSENSEESENVLFNVYNSIQEEVHAKSQMLVQVQGKLKAAKLEIRDLQAEFEAERDDYLATIRRLERDGQLMQSLLERMVQLVRRDCNYSNLDRMKKDAVWDEESTTWRLPDVTVQKTTLPSAIPQKLPTRRGSSAGLEEHEEEDRFKEMLNHSDSENIANSYFKSKRTTQLLGGEPSKGHVVHSMALYNGISQLSLSGSPVNSSVSPDSVMPRPFRLESLDVSVSNGKARRKKGKSHI